MNYRQLHYAILLSEARSFSQVAEKLNITQPALSKQILSLESELDLKLFDRSTTPLTVTPAGQYFIQEARELLYKEDQLLRSLERFKSGEAGQLVIGVTPFRSSYLIPDVVKAFRSDFPEIQVKLQEAGSEILRKEAAEGKYDFAVVNLPVDESVLDIIPLEADRLVLVVPSEWEHLLSLSEDCREIDFSACRELPFAVVQKNQEMRLLFEKLCATHNFHPRIAAEVVSLTQEMENCIPDQIRERELESKELGRLLDTFLKSQTPENRMVFMRRYWYVSSVKEIADDYGITESKVKMSLLRSRSPSGILHPDTAF